MTSLTEHPKETTNRRNAGLSPMILYISGFLDLFGVSMIIPLITAHCRDLGCSPTVTGILSSTYGAIQLFSSPMIGNWSDIKGRRYTLLVCLFMSGFGYSMFSFSKTITLMFLARVHLGVFKHGQSISKAYLSEITSSVDKSTVLGNFNAASSLGFILGPAVGGNIAERPQGFYLVALLAAFIFFMNGSMVWLFSSKTSSSDTKLQKQQQSTETTFSLTEFWQEMKEIDWEDLWDLYLTKVILGVAAVMFWSNFSLGLIQRFETSKSTNGYIISFKSTFSALCAFGSGTVAKLYSSNAKLVLHLAFLQSLVLLALASSSSLWFFVACLVPLAGVTSVARVASTSLSFERSDKKEIGLLLGFQQSCMSIARMIAPFIAGLAMEISPSLPAMIASFLSFVAALIMFIRPQDPRERNKKYQ